MLKQNRLAGMIVAGVLVISSNVAFGQEFPNKPVRFVAGGTGNATDFAARLIAQGLTGNWGQQVIVDNRPNGVFAGDMVARSAPDGYTLMLGGTLLWVGHLLQDNEPYHPVRDFAPVTLVAISPSVLVIHPSVPAKSAKELIALAKLRPGQLNYGSGGTGSATHLGAELFKSMAGINMVRIPYKSNSQLMTDLIAGQIQITFSPSAGVEPFISSGKLRALAVTGARRSAAFPELSTIAEAGLPGYEAVLQVGVFAPAKTPAVLINRLNQETVRVLTKADIKEKLLNAGMETVGSSPEQFAGIIKTDIGRWSKVIKDAGIRAD